MKTQKQTRIFFGLLFSFFTYASFSLFAQPGPVPGCNPLIGPNNDALIAGGSIYSLPLSAPAISSGSYIWRANGILVNIAGLVTSADASSTTSIPSLNVSDFAGMANGFGTAGILSVSYTASTGNKYYARFIHDGWESSIYDWHNTTLSSALNTITSASAHPEIASGYIIFNSNPSGGHIRITGDLIIDQDFEFRDCHILLNSDARIIINPGVHLTFHSTGDASAGGYPSTPYCRLNYGGKAMWDGIYISDATSQLKVYSDISSTPSHIFGSYNGIVSESGGVFTLSDVLFAHNFYHIQANNYTGYHTGAVEGCVFYGNSGPAGFNYFDYYDSWGLINPYPSTILGNYHCPSSALWFNCEKQRTDKGININNVFSIQIGNPAGQPNKFYDMDYGIYVNSSNATIENNEFYRINSTGIKAIGDNFTIDIGTASNNYFEKCKQGIFCQGKLDIDISNNSFTTNANNIANDNIIIKDAGHYLADVHDNSFSRYSTALQIQFSGNTSIPVNVHDNHFNIQPGDNLYTSYTAIYANGVFSFNCDLNIYQNPDITNSCTGIYIINLNNAEITDNAIWVSPNTSDCGVIGAENGILLTNSRNSSVRNNYLYGIPTPTNPVSSFQVNGIHAYLCSNTPGSGVIRNNIIENFGAGLYTRANCDLSRFACNDFNNCYLGFRFGDGVTSATIGDQLPDGSGGYLPTGNEWAGCNTTLYGSINPPVYWFYNGSGNFDPAPWLVALNSLLPVVLNSPQITSISNSTSCTTAGTWFSPPHPGDNELSQTLRDKNFEHILKNSSGYANYQEEHRYWELKHFYNSFDEVPGNLDLGCISDEDYSDFFLDLEEREQGAFNNIKNYISENDYSSALAQNTAINSEDNKINNAKRVNEIWLSAKIATRELTQEESAELEDIAYSNGFSGGDGVFHARAILGILVPDDENYSSHREGKFSEKSSYLLIKDNEVTIAFNPNPSKGISTVSYNLPGNKNAEMRVFDLLGNNVRKVTLEEESGHTSIDFSDLTKGIYFYSLSAEGKNIASGKIVIVTK